MHFEVNGKACSLICFVLAFTVESEEKMFLQMWGFPMSKKNPGKM